MTYAHSRRAQTRHENEQRLLDAARHCFATVGLERTSIQDIVSRSGLSRGTFYNYLGSKEAAFEAVAAQIVAQVAEAVAAARLRATDTRSFIVGPFEALVRVLAQDAETLALVSLNGATLRTVLAGPGKVDSLESELRHDLQRAIAGGLLPEHNTTWMTAAMLGAALEVVTRIESEGDVDRAGAFLGELFLSALSGLTPTDGSGPTG